MWQFQSLHMNLGTELICSQSRLANSNKELFLITLKMFTCFHMSPSRIMIQHSQKLLKI